MKTIEIPGLAVAAALAFLAGCNSETDGTAYTNVEKNVPADTGHSDEGIHGGHVVEVGDTHAYHAEIAFDKDTRNIDVYFYGAEIGTALPVSTAGFEFEMETDDGNEVELEAEAVPAEGETPEMASHFVIKGDALPASITSEEQLHVHFHVMIEDQEYSAGLEPHEHGDESKDHDDDDGHEDGDSDEEKNHEDGDGDAAPEGGEVD